MADHDSTFIATGGVIAQVLRQGGIASVYVDAALPAGGTTTVSVRTDTPILGVPVSGPAGFGLRAVVPNPFRADGGASVAIRFALPKAQPVRVEVFDLDGRSVMRLADGPQGAGEHVVRWDGRTQAGRAAPPAVYLVRLTAGDASGALRFSLTR